MHSEPSKAAMKRAGKLCEWGVPTLTDIARYIDTVDRVARDAIAHIHLCGGLVGEIDPLRNLMLPDEPVAPLDVIMREKGVGQQVRSEVIATLTAERDRLRAALEIIHHDASSDNRSAATFVRIADYAHQALNPEDV